jgi:hypothetical protein
MKIPLAQKQYGAADCARRTYVSPQVRVFGRIRELTTGGSGLETEFEVPPMKCNNTPKKNFC